MPWRLWTTLRRDWKRNMGENEGAILSNHVGTYHFECVSELPMAYYRLRRMRGRVMRGEAVNVQSLWESEVRWSRTHLFLVVIHCTIQRNPIHLCSLCSICFWFDLCVPSYSMIHPLKTRRSAIGCIPMMRDIPASQSAMLHIRLSTFMCYMDMLR